MKILIIGGVAAGTKVAAKLKRENMHYDVKLITKSEHISYAGCGLPYYVGNVIESKEDLIVNTPESFKGLTGVEVFTKTEATKVDPDNKKVYATNLTTEEEVVFDYDKLVIATGARPIKPPIEGIDLEGVFLMRTPNDAIALREYIDANNPRRAVVVGGGFIGLEVAENLALKDIVTTVIDMADQVPPGFEKELTNYIADHLADQGIMLFTSTKLDTILGEEGKVSHLVTDRNKMKTDLVILSLGVRPNTEFLDSLGLDKLANGTIEVNQYMETNIEDIYAVGDCAAVSNRLTKKTLWSPMGSTANIAGRIAAKNISGKSIEYSGAISTAVAQLPGLNIGRTGLTEAQAKDLGYDVVSVVTVVESNAHYFPGASLFIVKMISERENKKLLGLQVLGLDNTAVDKVVDIAVVGISMSASLEDLKDMDFAYAPPFSTAIHPFAHTVNVLLNKIDGEYISMTPMEYAEGKAEGYKIMDVSVVPDIPQGTFVELGQVGQDDSVLEGFDKEDKILLCCSKGKRGYMMQNKLKQLGYKNAIALEGGSIVNNIK